MALLALGFPGAGPGSLCTMLAGMAGTFPWELEGKEPGSF